MSEPEEARCWEKQYGRRDVKNAPFEPTLSAEAGSAPVQALGDLDVARKVFGHGALLSAHSGLVL